MIEGVEIHIFEQNDELHELDFEDEERDFTKFLRVLRAESEKREILLEVKAREQ